MSVLHVIPTYDTGGLGAACLSMIRGWPEKTRHHVIGPKWAGWIGKSEMFPAFAMEVGGNAVELNRHWQMSPPVWGAIMADQCKKFWRGELPTHVIQYNCLDLIFTFHALWRAQYKGRVLAHVGTVLPIQKKTKAILTSPACENALFVPVHRAVADGLIQLGVPPAKILGDVWNAVDLDYFDRPHREKALVFGFAARMGLPHQKNWPLLIDAFKRARIPGSVLRLAGDGLGQEEIKEMTKGASNIEFVGNVVPQKMPEFMANLDVFVMASHEYEGFANVISEAVASRCLMLGTDVPGVRLPFASSGGAPFLGKDAAALAGLMQSLNSSDVFRNSNRVFVDTLRPKLDAKIMAKAYYEAGLLNVETKAAVSHDPSPREDHALVNAVETGSNGGPDEDT